MVALNRKLKQLPSAVPSLEEIERIYIGGLFLEEQRLYIAERRELEKWIYWFLYVGVVVLMLALLLIGIFSPLNGILWPVLDYLSAKDYMDWRISDQDAKHSQ